MDALFEEEADGFGIEAMLFDLNAGVEGLGGVVGQDGNFGLEENRAGIHPGIDVVNGAAGFGDSGIECLAPCCDSGKGGKEGGVDIEDRLGKSLQQGVFDEAHEPGEADEIAIG